MELRLSSRLGLFLFVILRVGLQFLFGTTFAKVDIASCQKGPKVKQIERPAKK